MALIENAIYDILNSDATVTSIVSDRIRPVGLIPGDNRDSIVYRKSAGLSDHLLDQVACQEVEFEIDCYSEDYLTVKNLAKAAREALDSFSGTAGGKEVEAVMVLSTNYAMTLPRLADQSVIHRWRLVIDVRFEN